MIRQSRSRRNHRFRPGLCESLEIRLTPTSGLAGAATQVAGDGLIFHTAGFLDSTANPTTAGQSVTFRYALPAAQYAPGGAPTSETITYSDGPTLLGTVPAGDFGDGRFTTSALSAGGHAISAIDTRTFATGPPVTVFSPLLTQTVKTPTSLEYRLSTASSVPGQDVNIHVDVRPQTLVLDGPNGGTVTIYAAPMTAGIQPAPTALATVPVRAGAADYGTTGLSVGDYTITVAYSGDPNFGAASNPDYLLTLHVAQVSGPIGSVARLTPQAIVAVNTYTVLTTSAPVVAIGQTVTYAATVLPYSSGSGAPTGVVTFHDGTTRLGASELVGGRAALTVPAYRAGYAHRIMAFYGGGPNFGVNRSTTLIEMIVGRHNRRLVAPRRSPAAHHARA